jgi:predicted nucleotidyltransferase
MNNHEAVSRFIELAKQAYKNRLEKVILFGSYARETQIETSDIDLLIVLTDNVVKFGRESRMLSSIVTKIAVENGVWVSPKPTSLSKYLHSPLPLLQNIKEEGIVVYG